MGCCRVTNSPQSHWFITTDICPWALVWSRLGSGLLHVCLFQGPGWKDSSYSGHVLSTTDVPEPSQPTQEFVRPPSCHVQYWTRPPHWPKQVSRQAQHQGGWASHSGDVGIEEVNICWMITPTITDQYGFMFWLTWPASTSHSTDLVPWGEDSLTLSLVSRELEYSAENTRHMWLAALPPCGLFCDVSQGERGGSLTDTPGGYTWHFEVPSQSQYEPSDPPAKLVR